MAFLTLDLFYYILYIICLARIMFEENYVLSSFTKYYDTRLTDLIG